jgi:hypothetical protein
MKEPVRKFVEAIMAHAWHAFRKSQARENKSRARLLEEERRLFQGMVGHVAIKFMLTRM